MAAPIHHHTGPARHLTLTDKSRHALALDAAGIDLPTSYHAWGSADSPLCENGRQRVSANVTRAGTCRVCRKIGVPQKRGMA